MLSELTALIDAARSGAGQSIVLQGDAGIGKTTLLYELSALARLRGVLVLDAHCQDATGAPSFWPWQQILRRLVAATGRDSITYRYARAASSALRAGAAP